MPGGIMDTDVAARPGAASAPGAREEVPHLPEWWVQVTGEKHALAHAGRVFTSDACRVVAQDELWFVRSERLDVLGSPQDAWTEAGRLLECVNALLMLTGNPSWSLQVGRVYARDESGQLVRQRLAPRVGRVVMKGLDGSEAPLKDPGTAAALVRLQASDTHVGDALCLWSRGRHDWYTFCKIIEVLQASGVMREAMAKAGVSRQELGRLQWTANHRMAAGLLDARHARMKSCPPDAPMQVAEAEGLVEGLLVAFLLCKAATAGEAGD